MLSVAARPQPVKVNPSRRSEPDRCTTIPSGPACQSSTSASGTGSPAPSSTRPCSRIAPGVPGATSAESPSYSRPKAKNGPTV